MFTKIKAVANADAKQYVEAVCLSTDTKPTTGIANGSMLLEMNTGKIFMFNEDGPAWVELA